MGPNAPGAFCCDGLNLTTLRDPSYNYSIVPLWTDLIALQDGKHYVLGTPTSMTYGWYGVSEYYDPSRRNSFEVKIDNTGALDVRFSGALVTAHNVTSGVIGDLAKGEYYQFHHGWGYQTSTPVSYSLFGSNAPEDPCVKDPLASPLCPGYAAALLKMSGATTTVPDTTPTALPAELIITTAIPQTSIQTTAVVTPEPSQTTQSTTGSSTPTVSANTTTAAAVSTTPAPTVNNPQPKVGEVTPGGSVSRPSMSMIMSIVSTEQSRVSGVERSVLQETAAIATSATQQALSIAESSAASAVSASIGGSGSMSVGGAGPIASGRESMNVVTQQAHLAKLSSSLGIKAPSYMGSDVIQSYTPSETSIVQSPKPVTEVEMVKREELRLGSQSALDTLIGRSMVPEQPVTSSSTNTTVNRQATDNEAAGGVSIAAIAVQPLGYGAYLGVLKDVSFYEPKDIYRNQRVIDNQRALRQLSSDSLHKQLVDQQYRGN